MYKSVLVNTDINERSEVYNVSHCTHKLHARLQVLKLHDVAASHKRWRQLVTRVTARLFKLPYYVL